MPFVSRCITRIFIFIAISLFSTSLWAITDYQREQITRYLDSSSMQQQPSLFDGKSFNSSRTERDAANYLNAYTKSMNYAIRNWNMLSSSNKNSEEGKALLQRLQEAQGYQKAMMAALPALKTSQSGKQSSSGASAKASDKASSQSSTSGTKMHSVDRQRMDKYLSHNDLRMDKEYFDGKSFVNGAPVNEAKAYYQSFQSKLKFTLRTWNRMVSSRSKATDEGQQFAKRVAEVENWGKAMTAEYPKLDQSVKKFQQQQQAVQQQVMANKAATKENHRMECKKYLDTALTPQRRMSMLNLILQMQNNESYITSVDEVNKYAQVVTEFNQACQALDLKLITDKACWFANNSPENNPKLACEAAARGPELIKGAVINHAKRNTASLGDSHVQSLEQFHERNGWLTYEGKVTFKSHLQQGNAIPPAVRKNTLKLLTAAGLEGQDQEIWSGQNNRLETLKQEVEKTAGSWETPSNQGENYSSELVIGGIKRWHPDADIKSAFLGRSSWKIHRNALGVILRRSLPGYILFKLPSDPYCQLRSYTLTEQYSGEGQYEKASGVRIGYVRFQKCD